jgi:hypothetical protein
MFTLYLLVFLAGISAAGGGWIYCNLSVGVKQMFMLYLLAGDTREYQILTRPRKIKARGHA